MRSSMIALVSGLVAVLPALSAGSPHRAGGGTPDALAFARPAQNGQSGAPSLGEVVRRLSRYAAAYGAEASIFVGRETYLQRVEAVGGKPFSTTRLLSEFAIVKSGGEDDWIGYRDVVQVDDHAVVSRRDRLLALLTANTVDASQLKRIADESARYNIGPISRNFNVPTTALFFFLPATIERFVFAAKGTKEIDGVMTWELEFREKARPTLVRTLDGRDAACSGRVWVRPGDGTVIRTRLELHDFANREKLSSTQTAGGNLGAGPGRGGPPSDGPRRIESLAVVEVSYRLERQFDVWLPWKMAETYEGAVAAGRGDPLPGRATGTAEYSDFKRFATSARIVGVK